MPDTRHKGITFGQHAKAPAQGVLRQSAGPLWSVLRLPNLLAWWKADALNLVDGGSVTSWADSSVNGYTLTVPNVGQSNTAPVYKANIINGYPAVLFDGANHRRALTTVSLSFNQPMTAWAVGIAHTAANMIVWVSGTPGVPFQMWTNTQQVYVYAGTVLGSASAVTTLDAPFYWMDQWNGASSKIQFNGTQVASGDAGSGNISNYPIVVGAGADAGNFFWDGYIAEIIICQTLASSTDISRVNAYLTKKYGL